jgi:cytochrome c oxidase subunit 2
MSALEKLAIGLVLLIIVGLPAATLGYEHVVRNRPDHEFTLVGRNSTWSPKTIHVTQGDVVHLRLTSDDVAHGFLLEGYDVTVDVVYPGKFTYVDFVADKAGTFGFTCTRVCGEGHHQMWGELVVEPRA